MVCFINCVHNYISPLFKAPGCIWISATHPAVELHGSQGTHGTTQNLSKIIISFFILINRENPILLLIYGTMNLIKRKKWRACMIVNFEGVFKCRCWKAMHHSLLSSFGRCLLCYVEMKIPMHHNSRDFFFRDFILSLIFLKFMYTQI